jgi:bifunctional ADP-heptose synthase (sugar kinase/adenylyltransferase)
VFDVTGAGDTVISTLAAAIAAGEELPTPWPGQPGGGIVVGKLGTAAISAPELRRAIQREEGSERGVLASSNCCWPSTTPVRTKKASCSPTAASTSCTPAM